MLHGKPRTRQGSKGKHALPPISSKSGSHPSKTLKQRANTEICDHVNTALARRLRGSTLLGRHLRRGTEPAGRAYLADPSPSAFKRQDGVNQSVSKIQTGKGPSCLLSPDSAGWR